MIQPDSEKIQFESIRLEFNTKFIMIRFETAMNRK